MPFKFVREEKHHFIAHNGRDEVRIAKKGLSPSNRAKYRQLCKGGTVPQKLAQGGGVEARNLEGAMSGFLPPSAGEQVAQALVGPENPPVHHALKAVADFTGPENPPVHYALKALDKADPMGIMTGNFATAIQAPAKAAQLGVKAAEAAAHGPRWYSPLEEFVASAKQAKAPAKDWEAILAKAPGVKQEQIAYARVPEFLRGQQGHVTRDALLEHIRANQVMPSEYILGGNQAFVPSSENLAFQKALEDRLASVGFRMSSNGGPYVREIPGSAVDPRTIEQLREAGLHPGDIARDIDDLRSGRLYQGRLVNGVPDLERRSPHENLALEALADNRGDPHYAKLALMARMEEAHRDLAGMERRAGDLAGNPEHWWTAEGTEMKNLREKIPETQKFIADHQLALDELEKHRIAGTKVQEWTQEPHPDPEYEAYTLGGHDPDSYHEILFHAERPKEGKLGQEWGSPHFGRSGQQGGLVAHARVSKHWDADGTPMMMVEEIQSDLHQRGRDFGYGSQLTELKAKAQEITAQRDHYFNVMEQKYGRGTKAELLGRMSGDERMEYQKLADEALQAQTRVMNANLGGGQSPDVPWKGSEWEKMVSRRLLRHAAEQGYEKIAWPVGDIHAQRYSLQQHARAVSYTAEGEVVVKTPGGEWKTVAEGVKEDQLASYIGKDNAEKLLAQKPEVYTKRGREFTERTLLNTDFTIGGEGMREAYDKRIPATFKKLVEKYGGKVQREVTPATQQYQRDMETVRQFFKAKGVDLPDSRLLRPRRIGHWAVGDISSVGGEVGHAYDRMVLAADKSPDFTFQPQTIWTVTIPPALREQVLAKGMPAFNRGGKVEKPMHLAHEDERTLHIARPDGSVQVVAKNAISPELLAQLRGLPPLDEQGEASMVTPQRFAEGGQALAMNPMYPPVPAPVGVMALPPPPVFSTPAVPGGPSAVDPRTGQLVAAGLPPTDPVSAAAQQAAGNAIGLPREYLPTWQGGPPDQMAGPYRQSIPGDYPRGILEAERGFEGYTPAEAREFQKNQPRTIYPDKKDLGAFSVGAPGQPTLADVGYGLAGLVDPEIAQARSAELQKRAAAEDARGRKALETEGGGAAGPAPGQAIQVGQQGQPMPELPPLPDLMSGGPGTAQMDRLMEAAKVGFEQKARAEAAGLEEMIKASGRYDQVLAQHAKETAAYVATRQAGAQKMLEEIQNSKIDPRHFFQIKEGENKGKEDTWAKIKAGIAMVVSGLGAGLAGQPNLAYQIIDKAIERDIDAQKANLRKNENLYSYYLDTTRNELLARQMTKADLLTAAAAEMQKAELTAKQMQAGPNAMLASTQFLQQAQALRQQVLNNEIQIKSQQYGMAYMRYQQEFLHRAMGWQPGGRSLNEDPSKSNIIEMGSTAGVKGWEPEKIAHAPVMVPVLDPRTGKPGTMTDRFGNRMPAYRVERRSLVMSDANQANKANEDFNKLYRLQEATQHIKAFLLAHPAGMIADLALEERAALEAELNLLKTTYESTEAGVRRQPNEVVLEQLENSLKNPGGFTSSLTGSALSAMRTYEEQINRHYESIFKQARF